MINLPTEHGSYSPTAGSPDAHSKSPALHINSTFGNRPDEPSGTNRVIIIHKQLTKGESTE